MMKNKIIVRHTSIVINDYNIGDAKRLERFFSIFDRIYHKPYIKGIEYNEDTKQLIIPRGFNIHILENIFQSKATIDERSTPYKLISDTELKFSPRNEQQVESIDFILGRNKHRYTQTKSQLAINLTTGKGKTFVTIYSIMYAKIMSMMITSSLGWIDQWRDKILEYTNIEENEIYIISGTPSILHLLKKPVDHIKFYLASHDTIRSYGDRYGWDKVNELFIKLKIGIKVYDEAHLNFDNMCKIDFHTNVYKTLYLTATPGRSSQDEDDIFKAYFNSVPSINLYDKEIDAKTDYVAIHYNSRPKLEDISKCITAHGLNGNLYSDYLSKSENFYKVLHILMDILGRLDGKILIYIATNNMISLIKDWIETFHPEYIGNIGTYSGLIKNATLKFKELDNKIILTTNKSAGAALDIPGLKASVILADPFKSPIIAKQTLGRTRGNNTYYIDIVDHGFEQTKKYFSDKKRVFAIYANTCSEIVLTNDENLNLHLEKALIKRGYKVAFRNV